MAPKDQLQLLDSATVMIIDRRTISLWFFLALGEIGAHGEKPTQAWREHADYTQRGPAPGPSC